MDERHSQQDVEHRSVERLELVDPDPLLRGLEGKCETGRQKRSGNETRRSRCQLTLIRRKSISFVSISTSAPSMLVY